MWEDEENDGAVSGKLWNILMVGVLLIFVGVVVLVVASLVLGGSASVGGVVFIGPIPIVFGAGPNAFWLIAVGVVLAVIMLVSFFVLNRRIRDKD